MLKLDLSKISDKYTREIFRQIIAGFNSGDGTGVKGPKGDRGATGPAGPPGDFVFPANLVLDGGTFETVFWGFETFDLGAF